MRKLNKPCIKTGNFAKLCNTNKRTLFHYDEIGLFSPVLTDDKGYRYYTKSQCDVFFTITCLKDIGMPLKEIKQYIDSKDPENLKQLLLEQQEKVRLELKHLKRIEQVIQTKLELLEIGERLEFDGTVSSVTLESCPEEYLITSPALNSSDNTELFPALCQHISYCCYEDLTTGHPYGAIISVNAARHNLPDTYLYFFTKIAFPSEHHSCMIKPAGTYAVCYLKGDYYDASLAYHALFAFLESNGLTPGEFCYKEAIFDELTVDDETNYITRISFPIVSF